MQLATDIYRITRAFPKSETYGLVSQMQRAAVSIPSNIAEGHSLKYKKAYLRHLAIASSSLSELETQIDISQRLGYLPEKDRSVMSQANEVGKMLSGLRQSLQASFPPKS
jgi:four helix bundle protein